MSVYLSYTTAQRFDEVICQSLGGFGGSTFITPDGKIHNSRGHVPFKAIWTAPHGVVKSFLVNTFNVLVQPLNCWEMDSMPFVSYTKTKPSYYVADLFLHDPNYSISDGKKFENFDDCDDFCILEALRIIEEQGLIPHHHEN